ncbi:MAG: hypothetical protein ACRC4O_14690 [Giesbergeria sp.]
MTPAQDRAAHREAAAKLRGRPRYADAGRWPADGYEEPVSVYGVPAIGDTRAALRLLDVLADELVEARRGQQALPGVDVTCAAEE